MEYDWNCEIVAPPELHKTIQELFDAISWKLKHAESSSAQFATDINVGDKISRQQAIDALDKHIDTFDAIDTNYLCGLRTAMSILKEMPSAQPERQVELDGTESNIEILSELRAQFNCFDEVEEPCYRALSDAICALSAQPTFTEAEIQRMQELDSAQIQKAYEVGYEVGYEEGNKERKNGKWIEKEHSPFYCSVCGTYQYSASWEIKNKEYNFCPRCGARMEG